MNLPLLLYFIKPGAHVRPDLTSYTPPLDLKARHHFFLSINRNRIRPFRLHYRIIIINISIELRRRFHRIFYRLVLRLRFRAMGILDTGRGRGGVVRDLIRPRLGRSVAIPRVHILAIRLRRR